MRVWTGDGWTDGFLDYAPLDEEVVVDVHRWLVITSAVGLYFQRPRSLRLIWNYLSELGPGEVWRKVRSRGAERLRNSKYIACGLGTCQGPSGPYSCLFVAAAVPAGVDRIALPAKAVRRAEDCPDGLARADRDGGRPVPGALASLEGWTPWSGEAEPDWSAALDAAALVLSETHEWSAPVPTAVGEAVTDSGAGGGGGGRAILYGYGNYAKLYVLPNVAPGMPIARIAEIDPTQLPNPLPAGITWTTRGEPKPGERFDAWYIAGYHHTHADLAVAALMQGAAAVVEKPVAVDDAQLERLIAAHEEGGGRLFSCFHKRYSELTDLARLDLSAAAGAPIDYHCVVYEVPLPPRHWYRWPNSHSRIVSNGCHWIDHFLFLNEYSVPNTIEVTVAASEAIQCSIILENGAFFTMTLTENGSERLGVRDYIELRHGGVTVRMTDSSRYHAENSQKVLRKARVNRARSYVDMYRQIGERIIGGSPGDTAASLAVGTRAMLDVERKLLERYPNLSWAARTHPDNLLNGRQNAA